MTTIMNWSLKQIRIICLLIVFAIVSANALFAQSKDKFEFGASVSLGTGGAILTSEAYKQYTDTMKCANGMHLNKGVNIWFDVLLSKKTDLQMGLGFQQIGFARTQTGLTFKNYTYPGIGTGRIEDLSNTVKEITYNYRFSYLQFPLILNTNIGRSGNFKWISHFSVGITPQILMKHQLVAICNPGFSIEGKSQFKLDSSGFDGRILSLSIHAGFNFEYRAAKNKIYFFQPMLGFYPLSVSKTSNAAYPIFAGINVGVLLSNFE